MGAPELVPDQVRQGVVVVEGLTKHFGGVKALSNVGFTISAGEVVALAGENGAGKSTLKNLLAGSIKADAGTITVNGESINGDARHARRVGVAAIHQELSLFPTMNVAENVLMTSLGSGRRGIVRRTDLNARVRPLLERVGADFAPTTAIESLAPGQRQLVEIAKALALDPSVIIFDEPTASLNERERARIFDIVRQLAAHQAAILYISHHLSEIFDLSDQVVVLRDGERVGRSATSQLTRSQLESLMVGRELKEGLRPAAEPSREVALRVRELGDGSRIAGVSFDIHQGEIFGLAGLMGAGRTEVARAIFGVTRATGTVEIDGKVIRHMTPERAIAAGVAFVTEDRRTEGLFIDRPIRENLSVVALDDVRAPVTGWIRRGRELAGARQRASQLGLTARSGFEARAGALSGGNQQKVVIGKWLWRDLRVLIMDEPTRGIDVGAKAEIHRLLVKFAERGMAVLLISSELPELLSLAHRVGVMHAGRLAGILNHDEATPAQVIRLATGGGIA